jgi:hypothetical protein
VAKVFVDGRNVQRSQWPNLSDEELVTRVQAWANRHGHEAIIVFDGKAPEGAIGSGGESADDWLYARCRSIGAPGSSPLTGHFGGRRPPTPAASSAAEASSPSSKNKTCALSELCSRDLLRYDLIGRRFPPAPSTGRE